MGSMGSPERQPAHVMVILANENPTLPSFKTYTKNLFLVIHIKKTNEKLSVQSQTEVFRALLPKNEDLLAPLHGVVLKSIELQGYHNPAPFDFTVDLSIQTGLFSSSSSSSNIYGFKMAKNYSRTAPKQEQSARSKKGKALPSDESGSAPVVITCKLDFKASALVNSEDGIETTFKWKHTNYKTMGRFANFNFSALSGSSIRGSTLASASGRKEKEDEEERDRGAPANAVAATTTTTTTTTSESVATSPLSNQSISTTTADNHQKLTATTKQGARAKSVEALEELHLTDSLIHHLILSMINSDLASSEVDQRPQKLSHYASMLKYGVDNETLDTETELRFQLVQKQQQQQQQQSNNTNAQQFAQKKYVFINGRLCEEIRNQVKLISDSIRFANISDEGINCKIFMSKHTKIDEGDDYYVPFHLKVEYMYVPFDNVLESK